MYIWFPYKTPDLSEPQYNTPLPKVHTNMISYSLPNARADETHAQHIVSIKPDVEPFLSLFALKKLPALLLSCRR